MVVDSSVVMVENCVRRLAHARRRRPPRAGWRSIRDAAVEVRKPTVFGELIIMIVYLPILTLEGVEGKMFRPMALTVIFVLVGSMMLSLTLMPVLASLLLPQQHRGARRAADAAGAAAVRAAAAAGDAIACAVLGLAGGAAGVGRLLIALSLGSEFVPRLSEGAIVIGIVRLPGTDLEESLRYNTQMEQAAAGRRSPTRSSTSGAASARRGRHRRRSVEDDRHVHHAQAARAVDEGRARRPSWSS